VAKLIEEFGSEQNVAHRIRILREGQSNGLREKPGWSQAELARRMTEAGCPMDRTAIWKIENPDKPNGRRAITIGEMLTFAKVLKCSIIELLLPPEQLLDVEVWRLVMDSAEALNDVRWAWRKYHDALLTTQVNLMESPATVARVRTELDHQRRLFIEKMASYWEDYKGGRLDNGLPVPDDSEFEAWALAQGPTPLIAALEDALSHRLPRYDGWAIGRLADPPPSTQEANETQE
jgi:hypothetical protein